MKKKIQPIIAGVCLGGMLLTGCGKEERPKTPETASKESSDVASSEQDEDVKPVDAEVSEIECLNLSQLDGREIISICAVGDGDCLYASTCFEDSELAIPVYEVLRFDYDEELHTYKEPVVMEWREQPLSCVYFTVNPEGTKAYFSMLAEDLDAESSDDSYFLRLATADIRDNQLENLSFLPRGMDEGNMIISGVDQEENLYYVTEDMESETLVAKVMSVRQKEEGVELFPKDRLQAFSDLEQEEEQENAEAKTNPSGSGFDAGKNQGSTDVGMNQGSTDAGKNQGSTDAGMNQEASSYTDMDRNKESSTDTGMANEPSAKSQEATDPTETKKKKQVPWEEITNIRSIVKAEDGTCYFTAPGQKNGVYMIYSTRENEDGLFSCPELLPQSINDGVEDKLYCTVSTGGTYLYYISSKSSINDDGEFCSRTMLYRVPRETLFESSL